MNRRMKKVLSVILAASILMGNAVSSAPAIASAAMNEEMVSANAEEMEAAGLSEEEDSNFVEMDQGTDPEEPAAYGWTGETVSSETDSSGSEESQSYESSEASASEETYSENEEDVSEYGETGTENGSAEFEEAEAQIQEEEAEQEAEELKVNGKSVTAEKTFVAKSSGGYVDIEFSFDGSKLSGRKAVVFEKLFYAGTELTKHEDLNAKNQIVTIGKPEEVKPTVLPTATPAAGSTSATPSTNPSVTTGNQNNPAQSTQNVATAPVKTGDTATPFLWTALVLLSAMLVLAAWRKKYPK